MKDKIFIIEDDVTILASLKAKFSVLGFETRTSFGDGDINIIRHNIVKFKPDFIILDLVLPQVSGFDILKMIKNDEHIYGHLSTPVFVFADFSSDNIRRHCVDLGADYFFVKTVYTTVLVQKGNILQTVSETGTVKAVNELNLSFLNTGKLEKIYYKVGDSVKSGAVLAELDYSSLATNREEAQANLDVARANLNKLLAGATKEDIVVAEASTRQAQITYELAKKELEKVRNTVDENIAQSKKTYSDLVSKTDEDITTHEQSIDNYKESAFTIVEDKLTIANNALDVSDRTINDEDGEDKIGIKEQIYVTNTKNTYTEGLALLAIANSALISTKLNDTAENVSDLTSKTLNVLNKTYSSLQNCFNALENSVTSSSFTQSYLDTLKSGITTQQTLVNTAISQIQTAKQNLDGAILAYTTNTDTAKSTLEKAEVAYSDAVKNARNNLFDAEFAGEQSMTAAESKIDTALEAWQVSVAQENKVKATANKYDITLSQAKIRQSEAAISNINQQIENSIIKAPIDGQITKLDFEIGEQVMSGTNVVSILGGNNFEIEVLISEADIAKVNKGDKSIITLDSFGDDIEFIGFVEFIEPAETKVQDVIYYKVIVVFDSGEYEIKSGMTANVVVTTQEKNDVLVVPSRAVIDKNGDGKVVRVLKNNEIQEKQVTIGLRGDEGVIEILSGLNEGEEVVTYIQKDN